MNDSQAIRILGISGSRRSASFSTAILNALEKHSLPEMEVSVLTLEDIPFYNEDLDVQPALPPIADFRSKVAGSDGIVIIQSRRPRGVEERTRLGITTGVRVLFSRQTCLDHQFRAGLYRRSASTYQLRETLSSMLAHIVPGRGRLWPA